jgi:dUTP pyrophosphatase
MGVMRHPLSTSVKFKRLSSEVEVPQYETEGSAGMDLRAHLPNGPVGISPGEVKVIPTGLCVEVDSGYEAQVRPRSGLALRHRVTVLNSPGTIDSDYRGEVGVLLINHGDRTFIVEDKDRIAQLVICAIARVSVSVLEEEELSATARGAGGFGSTGRQ